jgi:hypothetical protein
MTLSTISFKNFLRKKQMVSFSLGLLLALLSIQGEAWATHVVRVDTGVFNGRLALTTNGTTYPLNAPSSTFASVEVEKGNDHWRFLLGGTFENYQGQVLNGSSLASETFSYGDLRLGAVYATSCCEWHFVYSRAQTPYTYTYSTVVNSVISVTSLPGVVGADYLRVESILYAKAQSYRLAFHYYFAAMLDPANLPSVEIQPGVMSNGGQLTSNYYLGGCARIFSGGDKFRIGPSICVDLQEMYLPNSVVVFRQEVGARLTAEF